MLSSHSSTPFQWFFDRGTPTSKKFASGTQTKPALFDDSQQVEPVKTQFLLHKFNAQATDFGYTRAFEHETIMAQRNIFIDPQGEAW